MKESDFIFYRRNNNTYSGGYKINNMFKKMDMPAIYGNSSTLDEQNGGELVIPAGLVLLQQFTSGKVPYQVHKPLQEGGGLYRKLKKQRGVRSKKKTRRSKRKSKGGGTRKKK